jgi:small GTP-binding protein
MARTSSGGPPTPFKVVLLGTVGVGKTSLLHRFNTDQFATDLYHTIGQTYLKKTVVVGVRQALLHLWDTPGQEQFASESTHLLRDARCCIICYDLRAPSSYEFVEEAIRRYDSMCRVGQRFVVVAGNKSDLIPPDQQEIELDRLIAAQAAHPRWAKSFLTSAASGEYVKELFDFIAARLLEQPIMAEPSDTINLPNEKKDKKSKRGCC